MSFSRATTSSPSRPPRRPGPSFPPPQSGTDPQGNWAAPAIYNAGPDATVSENPVSIALGDVNGGTGNDIVVADNNSLSGGIGVLLNTGNGTFPAQCDRSIQPSNAPSGVTLGNFVAGHTHATILDAAVANNTPAGGVSHRPQRGSPDRWHGCLFPPIQKAAGPGTDAIASGNFDGTGASIVAVEQGR